MRHYIAGPLGAQLYAHPDHTEPLGGYLAAAATVAGELIDGERVSDNPLWLRLVAYAPMVRFTAAPLVPPRKRVEQRCAGRDYDAVKAAAVLFSPVLCANCRRRKPPNRPARCANRLTVVLGPLQAV